MTASNRLDPIRLERIAGFTAATVAFAVYCLTMCPTVNFIDSGELTAVASTLGIAHPTGYPLFTLAGWFFTQLPLGLRVIQKLNIMSALFTAGALALYFQYMVYLLAESAFAAPGRKQHSPSRFYSVTLPALCGVLCLGFSTTYWSQALAVEVYSLHLVFLALSLLLFTKGVWPALQPQSAAPERRQVMYLGGFAFVLGLAFSNHMTTIFLAPAFLYLYFAAFGFAAPAWKRILWMAVPFAAGLSVYLYLPLRAAEQPLLNWGNPVTWDAFFRHTSAKQYSVWLFSSGGTTKRQLSYFLSVLPGEFAYAGLALALAGVWGLFRRHRKLFLFTALLFLGCVLYAINYDIHDIDSYFLLAYVTVGIWAAFGAREILVAATGKAARNVVASLAILCAVVEGVVHAPQVSLRDLTLVEDYTSDMLRSVGPNALVITYQWDYFVSASYYLQHVEGVRPDVVIIDKELLRRSWYYTQLERQHPWLIANSRAEVDAFLVELRKFEHELPYNPQVIEGRFAAVIRSFIERNAAARPVYVTPEIEPQYTSGMRRVPAGLAERIATAGMSDAPAEAKFSFRIPARRDSYVDGLVGLYAQAYVRAAAYEAAAGRRTIALELVAKALQTEPGLPGALLLEEQLKQQVNQGG
jgi:hypothetical protein